MNNDQTQWIIGPFNSTGTVLHLTGIHSRCIYDGGEVHYDWMVMRVIYSYKEREREKERWQMERDDSWSFPSGRPYHSYTSNLINVFSDYPEQASSNQIDFKTRWQRRDQETAVIMVWQKVFFLITPNDFQTALHKKARDRSFYALWGNWQCWQGVLRNCELRWQLLVSSLSLSVAWARCH